MGIFHSIKKSRRASSDIDEKIEYLNKELEKTGLREAMTTSNVYVGGQQVDNPIYTSFTSAVFNTLPMGHSPSDGSGGLGGAYTGQIVAGEHGLSVGAHDSILNLKGVANSPRHPVSGKRRYASTRTGMVSFSPTQPGVKQGNSDYPTGSVAWLWDPTQNNSDGTTGNWYPLEFDVIRGQWGFWDTNFLGFGFLNTNLSQLEFSSGDSTGSSVVSLFDTIGISNRENIGTEKTIVLQKNDLGSAGFLPININLSSQGFDYLKGRARRGAQRMIGKPTRRTRGGVGGRRKITSISRGLIPYGRGGKVSSRGVGNYIRGRGAGFSPSAGRVAQNVVKELPPKPTPAEIRNETVKQFRENGDNYAANKFYTEDRISELESKDNLTSTEQSELEQLKVNAVHMNQVSPPPEQVMAQAQEAKEEIYNDKSEIKPETTFEKIINEGGLLPKGVEAVKNLFDSYKSGELGLDILANKGLLTGKTPFEKVDYMADQIDKANTALNDLIDKFVPEATQKNVDAAINTFFDNIVDNFIEPEIGDMSVASNMLQAYDDFMNGDDVDTDFTTKFSKADIEAMKNIGRENADPNFIGKTPDQLKAEYLATDDPKAKQALKELIQNQLNKNINWLSTKGRPNSLGNTLGKGTNIDVDEFIENNIIKGTDSYEFNPVESSNLNDAHRILARMLGVSTDTLPMGGGIMTLLSPLAAKLLLRVPDDGTNRSWTENLEGEGGKAMPFSFEFSADEDAENPGFEPPKNIIEKGKDAVKGLFDKVKDLFNKDKSAKANADKYPPPKQESIFADEDGKVKYFTRSIYTGKDGKTYKEVLSLPWIEPKDGVHDGYFGSLYHPGSYSFKVPLFDTPMDEPLGDYTPPDDLPDIPFTPPEPEPEPDNRKDYEKNRDRQRRLRRSSYEPEGNVLSEEAKLGHFEPEQLTVDIEKLRKGILPEFPKDPPPKMVDGYSEKSKLAPKTIEGEPFINITKKDLAKNHMLKDSEIKEFMDDINLINKYIKENPSELAYAQIRYPKDDPRLAQLNWQMDQMLDASKEYMDKHYPENEKLFKKIQKSISKNIELTDPKSFKGVKVPKFEGVDLTDFKRRKEVVARHFKKAVKTKKLFSRKKT